MEFAVGAKKESKRILLAWLVPLTVRVQSYFARSLSRTNRGDLCQQRLHELRERQFGVWLGIAASRRGISTRQEETSAVV